MEKKPETKKEYIDFDPMYHVSRYDDKRGWIVTTFLDYSEALAYKFRYGGSIATPADVDHNISVRNNKDTRRNTNTNLTSIAAHLRTGFNR